MVRHQPNSLETAVSKEAKTWRFQISELWDHADKVITCSFEFSMFRFAIAEETGP